MGTLLHSLDTMRAQLGCHVSAIHHFGKNNKRGPRGHSLLQAGVDTLIEVARNKTTKVSSFTLDKQRDGEAGAQFAFRLKQVTLGRNLAGDPVTSCIVVPAEGEAAQLEMELSAPQTEVFEALMRAINSDGEEPPPSDHIPPGKRCVREDLWRRACYEGSISASEKASAKSMAFGRASQALVSANKVGKWGGWVWVV
jgi:hypothetical protein